MKVENDLYKKCKIFTYSFNTLFLFWKITSFFYINEKTCDSESKLGGCILERSQKLSKASSVDICNYFSRHTLYYALSHRAEAFQ